MDGWTVGWMNGWKDGSTQGWVDGCTDEWMALRKEGLTNGWGLGFGN